MKKIYTKEQFDKIFEEAIPILVKELGLDPGESEYTIVQAYEDGNGIILAVEEDGIGEREVSIKVFDSLIVLPKKEGTLDVFK